MRGACGARLLRCVVAAGCAVALIAGAGGVLTAIPGALAGCGEEAQAWADPPTNEAVPTDDTGVVDPSAGKDDQQSESTEQPAGQPGGAPPAVPGAEGAGEGASDDAQLAEGEGADGEGGEGEAAPTLPKPVIPDPVFGSGVNPDNLVNPQQKPDSSFIYDTSISALQDADSYLNNQTVQVTGEVVGDRIRAELDPGFCWIVLQSNDNAYAEVPVFISEDATEPIDIYGSYGRKGTTLQVRGIFHLSCSDHEGLTDLHADTVTVVEKGSVTEQTLNPAAFAPGAVLVGVGLVMLLVFRHMREGRR